MAVTTNYNWTTPDDTNLVKDGASAIRTLGSSVDTTVKNLNPETTLGDISYRSSTANVKTRLGLGTAGQVLQVNSGATAPEWATFTGGGLNLIKRASFSNVANTGTTFDNVFTSSYRQYLVVLESLSAATTSNDLQWQGRSGATTQTTGYYGGGNSNDYLSATANIAANNASLFTLSTDVGDVGGEGTSANIWVSQVGNTVENMNIRAFVFTGNIAKQTLFSGAISGNSVKYDGFLIKSSSSNITGAISVYGLAI